MGILIEDKPAEIRMHVQGGLMDTAVSELNLCWSNYQAGDFWQKLVVDLSAASECDTAGECLLARMMQEGAQFSARTSVSLEMLRRVTERASRLDRSPTVQPIKARVGAA
jgi:hypothetical protein